MAERLRGKQEMEGQSWQTRRQMLSQGHRGQRGGKERNPAGRGGFREEGGRGMRVRHEGWRSREVGWGWGRKQDSCQVLGSNLTRPGSQPQQTQGMEAHGGQPLRRELAWSRTQATWQDRGPGFQHKMATDREYKDKETGKAALIWVLLGRNHPERHV